MYTRGMKSWKRRRNVMTPIADITKIDEEYARRCEQGYQDLIRNIHEKMHSEDTVKKAAETSSKRLRMEIRSGNIL